MPNLLKCTMLLAMLATGMGVWGQMPHFASKTEKEAWIKAHPEEYQRMNRDESKPAQFEPVLAPENRNGPTTFAPAEPYKMDYSKTGGSPAPAAVAPFFGMGIGSARPAVIGVNQETGEQIPVQEAQDLYQLRLQHWLFVYAPADYESKYGRHTGPIPGGRTAEQYRTWMKASITEEERNNTTSK